MLHPDAQRAFPAQCRLKTQVSSAQLFPYPEATFILEAARCLTSFQCRMPVSLVVCGVSACGKTTLGAALATALSLPFQDADALHPPANVAKMAGGTPLDDDDRAPWLAACSAWLQTVSGGGVLACSALKRAYRTVLAAPAAPAAPADAPPHGTPSRVLLFVFIHGAREDFFPRISARAAGPT